MYRYSHTSTPKNTVDTSVDCDLPFDESAIAPELRRGHTDPPSSLSLRVDVPGNSTDLVVRDISLDTSISGSPSTPPGETEDTPKEFPETGREKESEETVLTTGGLRVPVTTSPADIYKHFPRRVTENSDSSSEETSSSSSSESDDQRSDSNEESLHTATKNKENISAVDASLNTDNMQAQVLEELQAQVASLKDQLESQQERQRDFQRHTVNAFEPTPIPDTASSQRPAAFHGFDSEDINRWLDKVENYLKLRRINTDSPTALAELILLLAGPAEDFYYSLTEDKKDSFAELRDALRERFANENQHWILWQAVSTRQQGTVESLDTYLNDLSSKFRRLNIADADKMRYFVQGLRPEIRETVLLKQPKTFQEAEEMARLACAVKKTMNSSSINMAAQLSNRSQTLSTLAAGTSTQPDSNNLQSINTMMDILAKKLDSVVNTGAKTETVAAYAEPESDEQRGLARLMRDLKDDLLGEIRQLDRKVDARINDLAQRGSPNEYDSQIPRQRTRDGRPICFNCGAIGHLQQSCPYRRTRPIPNAPPALEPQRGQEQRRYPYEFGMQSRRREIEPPQEQERMAAYEEVPYFEYDE